MQQSYRQAAGFGQIQQKDKWLGNIALDGALQALTTGLCQHIQLDNEKVTLESLIVMGNLLLESGREEHHKLLEKFLAKLAPVDSSKAAAMLSKALRRARDGNLFLPHVLYKKLNNSIFIPVPGSILLPPDVLESILQHQPKLLEACCAHLVDQQFADDDSWLVRASCQHAQLYQRLCRQLMTTPSVLAQFVESVSRHQKNGSFVSLYPVEQQPCVLLYQAARLVDGDDDLATSPIASHLIEELLQLWLSTNGSSSVAELLSHFPFMAEMLVNLCDTDVSAQRLCLHMLSGQ